MLIGTPSNAISLSLPPDNAPAHANGAGIYQRESAAINAERSHLTREGGCRRCRKAWAALGEREGGYWNLGLCTWCEIAAQDEVSARRSEADKRGREAAQEYADLDEAADLMRRGRWREAYAVVTACAD